MFNSKYSKMSSSLPFDELLKDDEVILLVDDYPDIVVLLRDFLVSQSLPAIIAGNAKELHQELKNHNVALVLLDIGLPDGDGIELLPGIIKNYPDIAVVMLTAVTDLQTALDSIRHGAEDYLTKPVQFTELYQTVSKALEKRRLTINNRLYQRQIEKANFQIQFHHELTLKMNNAYLNMVELDEMLQAILVGITADEGLQFNRAFLALFDESGDTLQGRMAIGPGCREEAGRIWEEMENKNIQFSEILTNIKQQRLVCGSEVNDVVQKLSVNAEDEDHLLMKAVSRRQSINVVNGKCDYFVADEIFQLLEEDSFVVVPLFSPSKSLGVIIADHFVTGKPIDNDQVLALENFANQASLAIEHCNMYVAMENKISELEIVTHELEKNKDLLVESERYSALGQMAAQLAHSIRNPITTIGGTARMLTRKTNEEKLNKFFEIMASEAAKVESTLEDLFSFVELASVVREPLSLYALINKSIMLNYSVIQKQHIEHILVLPDPEPVVYGDEKQIHQMFVHLVRNGLEAMPEGGKLTVKVSLAAQMVVISFCDTGIGIDPLNASQAKDPFFTTKSYGTGMGLTLVERIIKDHDGSVKLLSREQGGTEVILKLPLSIS